MTPGMLSRHAHNRWLLLAFAVLVALSLAAPVAALSQSAEEVAPTDEPTGSSLPLPDPAQISASVSSGYAKHQSEMAEREDELAEPPFVAERERSQDAYADMGSAAAEGLLRANFGDVFEDLEGDPARFLGEAKVDRVLEPDAATVTSEGDTQLLETSIPVQAETEDGEKSKVDLGLERTDTGFELKNPLVKLAIGDSAAAGVEISESDVTITQVDATRTPARSIDGTDVFFGEVIEGGDTDLMVSPISNGVELFDLLRSSASPEVLRFDLALPPGAQLRMAGGESAEILDSEGNKTLSIPKPWARDSQGTAVPVTMAVEGNSLVLTVAHRDEEVAYPVLVDPTIYQDWGWWYSGQHLSGLSAFRWQAHPAAWWVHGTYSDPGGFPGYDNMGLFVWTEPAGMGPEQWGQWIYSAPNAGSYISSSTINPFWRNDSACTDPSRDYQPYDYEGTIDEYPGHVWNELRFNDAKNYGYTNLPTWGRALIFGLSTDARGTSIPCYRHLMAGGVGVWMDDWQNPTVAVGGIPSGWVKKDATARSLSVSAGDGGLGVQSVAMTAPTSWGWNQPWCAGTYENRCSESTSGTIAFNTSGFPEGAAGFTVEAVDPTAKRGSTGGTIYVDGSAPTVTLKGESTTTAYKLGVEAKDSFSGVKESKVYLDGSLKETKSASCTTGGCPGTMSWTYSQGLTGLAVGQHTLEVISFDQVGYQRSAVQKFEVTAPDTVIDSGPEGLTKNTTPTFTYHSTQTGSSFSCSIDAGAFAACPATGYTAAKLSDGPHTLRVKAISAGGIEDPTPASRSFTVDTTAPETTLEYGPGSSTNDPKPTFGYSSPDPRAGFQCKIDAAAFESCGYEFQQVEPPLADGMHTFSVRAVDEVGNVDPTPAGRSFEVDATAPTIEILTGPSGYTKTAKPKFTFKATGQSSLQCALESNDSEPDEPSYGPCSGSTFYEPASALAAGSYVFRVKVADAAGNVAKDERFFTVDTSAPDTTITSGPSGTTDDPKPTFSFSSNEPSTSFACRFDAESFAPCSGPGSTHAPKAALTSGAHTFEVRATDAAGNVDASPAKRSFTVFTAAPETKIDSGPEGPTVNTSPTFTYSADETATFECRVDGAAFASCPSTGRQVATQPEGEHVFEVRARNAAGVDPTPARRVFVVDTSNPEAPVLGGEVFVEPGPYGLKLTIAVRDGDRSTPASTRSGVESATLQIDGQQAVTLRIRCGPLGCPDKMEREYQVSPYKVTGAHSYKLIVRDQLGHERTAEWSRTIPANTIWKPLARSGGCPTGIIMVHESPYVGGPCSETIMVKPGYTVKTIEGKGGNDTIIGGPGEETLKGGEGNDIIRGARSNDKLYGDGGEDALYGGIGDDALHGGPDKDTLDGGPGGDNEFGDKGDDTLRGGQGKDFLRGGSKKEPKSGDDTVSFADAISPGFKIAAGAPLPGGEVTGRTENTTGVDVEVEADGSGTADNGSLNEERGGTDTFVEVDHLIGSAFDDVFRRADPSVSVDTGPGGDIVVEDGKGAVEADGQDYVEGNPNRAINHPDAIEFGLQNKKSAGNELDLFFSGNSEDNGGVRLKLTKTKAEFKFSKAPGGKVEGCSGDVTKSTSFTCRIPSTRTLGAVVISGNAGEDNLSVQGRDQLSDGSVILVGGPGRDVLTGSDGEDVLIDGLAQNSEGQKEVLRGLEGDDVIIQGDGRDKVEGGGGNDLLVSANVCGDPSGGDELDGGAGADNAQFHPFSSANGVYVNLREHQHVFGEMNVNPKCSSIVGVEDLEGSPQGDDFIGLDTRNFMLGRGGADTFVTHGGHDKVNSKDKAVDAEIDCANDAGAHIHVDPNQELPKGNHARKEVINTKPFRHCIFETIDGIGRAYPDQGSGGGQQALLAESERPVPERLERLVGSEASQPPESWTPALEDPSSLASYYAFDETEGTAAMNAEEEALDGVYEAAGKGPSVNGPGPNIGVAGSLLEEEGSAVSLDGVDDLVSLPAAVGLGGAAERGFGLELIAKFAKAPVGREYLFAVGQGENGLFLYRSANGVLTLATGEGASAPQVDSYQSVFDNGWHQLAVVVESKALTLYLDGIPSRVGFGEPVAPELANPGPATVGVGPGQSGFLAGTVDELSTYVGGLSEATVLAHLLEMNISPPTEVLIPEVEKVDSDGDGVADGADNCPNTANADQLDANRDGVGDACLTPDKDEDGVEDQADNCPEEANSDQADSNGDGVGDVCSGFAPEVVTEGASEVKEASARVSGSVLPGGTATNYHFEYGTTTSYGKSIPVPSASLASGSKAIAVSQAITGLAAQTTYHYRLVAENQAGPSEGEDRTFTTLKAAIPTGLANLPIVEPFNGTSASVNNFNSLWAAVGWASGKKGTDSTTGWGPIDAFPTVNGASYSKSVSASANGIAVAATLNGAPTIAERYFSLWLGMPSPANSSRAGYELRFTETATQNSYNVTVSSWAGGTKTVLAQKAALVFPVKSQFALVAKGGFVTAWTAPSGGAFTELLSAKSATYTSGYSGLEGAGNYLRLTNFKTGVLP